MTKFFEKIIVLINKPFRGIWAKAPSQDISSKILADYDPKITCDGNNAKIGKYNKSH